MALRTSGSRHMPNYWAPAVSRLPKPGTLLGDILIWVTIFPIVMVYFYWFGQQL